jgi:hypothetical protein
MEAHFIRAAICALALLSMGASYRSANFVVSAATPELAEEIGLAAEKYRDEMAQHWLGHTLPNWSQPCPIRVEVGDLGAGGVTSFVFDRGEVYRWEMAVQGTRERVLDSVLPHEVTHTIFASHFRQQLPRWADEGACTTVEHDSERSKHEHLLVNFLQTGRGIAFNEMFQMKEYPADILPLYSQGHALAQFLIGKKGPRAFIRFVEEGLQSEDWTAATKKHYGFENLSELQTDWLAWVKEGCPREEALLASNDATAGVAQDVDADLRENAAQRLPRPTPNLIYRAQNARRSKAKSETETEAAPAASAATAKTDGWRPPSNGRRTKPLVTSLFQQDEKATSTSTAVAAKKKEPDVILEWRRSDTAMR